MVDVINSDLDLRLLKSSGLLFLIRLIMSLNVGFLTSYFEIVCFMMGKKSVYLCLRDIFNDMSMFSIFK